MATTYSGFSDAARLLDQTRKQIFDRCNDAVTLSRNDAIEALLTTSQQLGVRFLISCDLTSW